MYDDAVFDEVACEEFYAADPRDMLLECANAEAEGDEKPL